MYTTHISFYVIYFNMVGFITRITFTLGQLTINLIFKKQYVLLKHIYIYYYVCNSKTFLNSICKQNTNSYITGCWTFFTFHSPRHNPVLYYYFTFRNHHKSSHLKKYFKWNFSSPKINQDFFLNRVN